MNKLSWLLYLGGVTDRLSGIFIIIGIMVFFIGCLVAFNRYDSADFYRYSDDTKSLKKRAWHPLAIGLVIGTFLWNISAFMPRKETVYAIAASEVGDSFLHSKTGSLTEQAIDSWLKHQINKKDD